MTDENQVGALQFLKAYQRQTWVATLLQKSVRPEQCLIQIGHDVFFANPFKKPRLVHQKVRLGMRAAQDEMFAVAAQLAVQVLQGM